MEKRKGKLVKDIAAMKETLRESENKAESVSLATKSKFEEAKELLAHAQLMRRDTDRDVLQATKSVQELTVSLQKANQELADERIQFQVFFNFALCVLSTIGHDGDDQMPLLEFLPMILSRFREYLQDLLTTCVGNILGYIWVLAPDGPLECLVEADAPAKFLDQVEAARDNLGDLVDRIVDQIDTGVPPPS